MLTWINAGRNVGLGLPRAQPCNRRRFLGQKLPWLKRPAADDRPGRLRQGADRGHLPALSPDAHGDVANGVHEIANCCAARARDDQDSRGAAATDRAEAQSERGTALYSASARR